MKMKEIKAWVESAIPLTDSILQIILTPEVYIDYTAGQYLQILSSGAAFSYSIANAPLGSHKYELHIRHSLDNPATKTMLEEIKKKGEVILRLPQGDCHINRLHKNKPIIFIAAGTGFAPIKAMIEQLLADGYPRVFELYWGARSQSDLYLDELVMNWQKHVSHFRFFSRLSSVAKEETLPAMVRSQHFLDLADWQIVLGGPFDMVYATRDALVAAGAKKENLFSDAFSFEEID